MKILVTGGAGYIGSVLVPMLLEQGHKVTVYDSFLYRQNSLASYCANKRLQLVRGDIRSSQQLKPYIKKADVIIPLAALVGAPVCKRDPVGAKSVNYDANMSIIDMCSAQQVILMPTTNSAYGSGDQNNCCTEESPLRPISQYAIEKVELEKRLMQRENSVSFRLATVFGMSPRMRLDLLVNDFTYRAVKDRFIVLFESHFKRNYVHVRDVSRVFLHAIDNYDSIKSNIFNVGLSEANLSKKELCMKILEQVPDFIYVEEAIGKDPDQRNYIVSNEKIESTGFQPEFTLSDGITELIKGFQMITNSVYSNV